MLKLRVREVAERMGIPDAAALSRRVDISTETAYRLFKGDVGSEARGVGLQTLYKVARGLGVRMEELYEEIDE